MDSNEDNESTGLEFYTTEQLFGELAKRFDGCLFTYSKTPSDDVEHYGFLFSGSPSLLIGLAERTRVRLITGDYEEPEEGGEE